MSRAKVLSVFVIALGALASSASADPILKLSSPDDLGNLSVGQEFQIDVTLSGLRTTPEKEFIFVLNSKILFDGTLLDPVSGPSAFFGTGSVFQAVEPPPFPVPQVTRFNSLSSASDGSVIGNFTDAGSAAINSEGLFYSFRLKAQAVGTGQISFDKSLTQFASFYTNFALAEIDTGDPLTYNIKAAVVPEPSTWALALSGALLGGCELVRRRRRQAA